MMDKTTEIIAHMVGIFHITLEEERMREIYEDFTALRLAEADLGNLLNINVIVKAPYSPEGFSPYTNYRDIAPPDEGPWFFFQPFGYFMPQIPLPMQIFLAPDAIFLPAHLTIEMAAARPLLILEPPGSVATATYQYAWLEDNDDFELAGSLQEFEDTAAYTETLKQYHTVGQALEAAPRLEMPDFSASVRDDALATTEAVALTEAAPISGASIEIQRGEATQGTFENGIAVDTVTRLDDVMPAYFRAKNPDVTLDPDAEETSEENGTSTGPEEGDSSFTLSDAPAVAPDPFQGLGTNPASEQFAVDPGHLALAGGNMMINEAGITLGWLDAPVISVMGDVITLDLISQVNVMVSYGSGNGVIDASASTSINSAMMSRISSAPPPEEITSEEETGEETATATGESGDYGTDSTDAGAPGKTGPDATAGGPPTLPSNWAVTRIEGDLLTVNFVEQYSFMTDHDRADITFNSSNTYIGLGDNTVVNITQILEIGFGYDLIIIGGNMITVNQIFQLNVMIDIDNVTWSGSMAFSPSFGDNLVFNGASITATGIDSYAEMQDNFANAADQLGDGAITVGGDVARDSAFEGIDLLRVLYIDGDHTMINSIRQTNVMGDSDQVHLALDNFEAATGAEASVSLVSGSNAAINLAAIDLYGTDSTVHVGGEVYSDALIYQAELIDTGANPLGVNLSQLTSEAVAFLAEGMLTTPDLPDTEEIAPTPAPDSTSPDVMQTMLA